MLKSILKALPFYMVPFILFFFLEFYTHDPWDMAVSPTLINYILFLSIFLIVYAGSGSIRISTLLIAVYTLISGIANYFVMEFRGNPILPWDLKSIKTALSVSNNYSYEINYRFIISTIGILLTFFLVFILTMPRKKILLLPLKHRIFFFAIFCGLFTSLTTNLKHEEFTNIFLTPTNLFTQWASYRDNGFTVSFLQNLKYINIKKPSSYDKTNIEKELDAFLTKHSSENKAVIDASNDTISKKPNIITIINESFADLSVLHDFDTNVDYMPFIHSLQNSSSDNVITGRLFTSVLGGNTANSEFEYLTGNTLAFLPQGSVAYQQYISGPIKSLVSEFNDNNYHTISLHPYGKEGWNRDIVYPYLGFDESLFRGDFYNARIIRNFVSDETAFDKIIELYEYNISKNKNNPLFLYEVTMQNHGGYSKIYDNFPISVKLKNIKTSTSLYTENYLSLIKESDRAFENLINYFKKTDEPVIILMFGDHQPNDFVSENISSLTNVKKENRSLEELQNRYIVPYVIWANFNINKYNILDSSNSDLSCNYLGAYITNLCGIQPDKYQQFIMILHDTLPVITGNVVIDANGNYMTIKDAKEKYKDLMNLYEKLQYYYLFDNN